MEVMQMHHSTAFLLPSIQSEPLTYALVVLNQRLPRFTPLLWNHSKLRVCADGGANRLYDEMPQFFPQQDALDIRHRYQPDVIKGDMDSIRYEVLNFYTKLLCVLVTGALGGRFDPETGNINVLCRFSSLRVILLSDDCLIQVLPKTHRHQIHIQSSVVGPHGGLIPIGIPSKKSTTSGLKWNLTDTEMKFGGLVSMSNIVTGDVRPI